MSAKGNKAYLPSALKQKTEGTKDESRNRRALVVMASRRSDRRDPGRRHKTKRPIDNKPCKYL
jgi:hypothetical protein